MYQRSEMRLGDPRVVEPEGCGGAQRVHGHVGIGVEGSNDGKSPSEAARDGWGNGMDAAPKKGTLSL